MESAELLVEECICIELQRSSEPEFASDEKDELIPISRTSSPQVSATSSPASSILSYCDSSAADPHAPSHIEALSYYTGLPSEPVLIYRTGKPWFPPKGPEAQRRTKELRPVFNHAIVELWAEGGLDMEVVGVLEKHGVLFTSIDVVRFLTLDSDPSAEEEEHGEGLGLVGPVTLWIGAHADHTPAALAHAAAQDILALLRAHGLTDIDVDFRGSVVRRFAFGGGGGGGGGGPRLRLRSPASDLDPLVDVVGPLTSTLGVGISSLTSSPEGGLGGGGGGGGGTMSVYLNDGKGRLLGLTCRHVLFGSDEANYDYVYRSQGAARRKNVVHLSKKAYDDVVESIQDRIRRYGFLVNRWRKQIAQSGLLNATERMKTEALVREAEDAVSALEALLHDVKTRWRKRRDRVLGYVLRSPAMRLGVGEERYTEDWAVFRVERDTLGDGFRGNVIDLGTKIPPDVFTLKCSSTHSTASSDWSFEYPIDRLLPLRGTLSPHLMRHPDMLDSASDSGHYPSLLVVKSGSATGTTLGRANGVFSIVREYFSRADVSVHHQTSVEWCVLPYGSGTSGYDSKSGYASASGFSAPGDSGFSKPGDSGSVIADIRGRIGGILTGGSGAPSSSSSSSYSSYSSYEFEEEAQCDLTYATPFEWVLERVRGCGFPGASLDVDTTD